MNREDRAKQFAPFEALTGLRKALAQKEYEHEKVDRAELSDEAAEEICKELMQVSRGDRVELKIYHDGYYVKVTGMVKTIDPIERYFLVGDGKVFFSDIYGIKRL